MATYTLTPAERKARAQELKKARENRFMYQRYLDEKKKLEDQRAIEEQARLDEESRIKNQNFLIRGLSTVGDVVANVLTGAVKGLEGIVDLGIGLVGAVGGIFDGDFQSRVKDVIAYDWTGETFGNALQEALKYSYTTNGGIIEGVASGIGQMLPAVVACIATAGASAAASGASFAASMGSTAAQTASLVTLGISAAGTSTEDAFQEGADYWAGLGYGVASGLVEVATEKMFGGATKALTGAGIFDGVTKSVADTGLKRIAKNVIEEGVEEVVAELANPALKSIYKGKDAFSEYGEGEYWKGVGKAGLVGSLTALAYSGSVGYGLSKVGVGYVGKEADIADSLSEINSLKEKANNLQANGELSELNEQKIADTTKRNYQNIEKVLQGLSEEKRARYIEKFNLNKAFNADGTMSEQLSAWLNAGEQTESGDNSAQSGLASLKKDSYSFNLRGNESTIEKDLQSIKENRAKQYAQEHNISIEEARDKVGDFKVFAGEMTEKAKESRSKFNKGLNYLNKISGGNISFVITEANETFNGLLLDGRTIYIGEDTFENDNWAGTLVHEYTHFAEGTKEYNKMVDFMQSDDLLVDAQMENGETKKVPLWLKAQNTVLGKGYGFDIQKLDDIRNRVKNGTEISKEEAKYFESYRTEVAAHQSEYLLGNEEFIDRLVAREASLAQKVIKKIQSLKKMFSKVDGKPTRAEYKHLLKAEKLYLKAASKAGNAQIVKMILAHNPDLSEEIDNSGEIQYNKKTRYIQYRTLAIQWANNPKTKQGDIKILFNPDTNTYNKIVADSSYDVGYRVVKSVKDTAENAQKIEDLHREVYNEDNGAEQGTREDLHKNFEEYERQTRNFGDDLFDDKNKETNGRTRGVVEEESGNDGNGDSRKSGSDSQVVKYSLKDSVESDVVKEYGKTYRWSETGYILKDGTRLDLSGRNEGAPGGYRAIDHRDIFSSYEDIDGTEAMIEFMERGNIRVSPENPGINLQVEPTEEQYRQIGEMVEKLGWKEKSFSVDFDDKNGNTIDTLNYEGNVSFRKVISDIRYYFKEGKVPYQSELSKFRYLLKPSQYESVMENIDSFKTIDELKSYFGEVQSLINDESMFAYPRSMQELNENEKNRVEKVIRAAEIEKQAIKEWRKKHSPKKSISLETKKQIEEIDKQYTEAIKNKDLETAKYLVEQMAILKGYSVTDYRIDHTAPYKNGHDASLDDVSSMYGEDIYGDNAIRYFGTYEGFDSESIRHIQDSRGKPDKFITVYRAVPKSIKANQIRNGDWITLTYQYAANHGRSNIIGNYRIISKKVRIGDIYTNGDSIHEFGYDDGMDYYYRDTENFRKLADVITFDDKGNPIRLKDRFNYRNSDIRYALKQDSNGRNLSDGQIEYFKDSKAVDENGNLMTVYHGSKASPTVFKNEFISRWNAFGKGFYFTTDKSKAMKYKKDSLYETYLNIKNPFITNDRESLNLLYEQINNTKEDIDSYSEEKGIGGSEFFRICNYLDDIGRDVSRFIKELGFDGVIHKGYEDTEYVVFDSNQIKLTDNLNPTENEDIRFDLKPSDKYFYEFTDGQIKKLLADKTKMKVYSKVEAEQVINTILDNSLGVGEKYGRLVGKSKSEVVEMLWRGLNTAEPGKQMHVALDIAEYIIQNSVLENLYDDNDNQMYVDTISVLKPYLHSLDLSGIKGDIKYHYDTDNSPYLIWGKRKGDIGTAPDQLKHILEEEGFYIESDVGADIFFYIDNAYREAVNALKKKSKELLNNALSPEERKSVKNRIAREVLLAFDKNGKPSQFSKILDEYGKQAKFWKEKFYDEKIRGKARDSLFEAVDRVKGLEKYQRADVKLADEVLGLVKLLKKIKTYRGNISKNVRQIMLEYSKEVNGKKLYELLSNNTEGETNPFAEDIERIAHANGELSTQEIRALDAIIRNFIHNVNEYDRVFFEGRSQSETEVATTAINETRRTVKISDSGAKGLIRRYINYTTNPVNRFRRLGNYSNDSIIARIYAELQKGANKQSLFKQKVDALFDDFMKAHKKEIAAYDNQDIEIGGIKMSKGQMISLYLTFLRQQGRSHLFGEGDEGVIRLSNEKAKKQGLKESYNKGEDVKISRATIEEIQSKFSQTDKEFILLAQKFFNGEEYSKGAITETQEALYGVAMVEDDFYFPLRVADDQIYKEIGNDSLKDLFTVYSPSFTKAVREGANNKVVIENVLDVIKRHSNQMAAYYGLAQPIRTFNRLLNKKVEGANLRSVITSVDSSFIDYANKLLGDLQGSNARRGTFDRVVGKIRSWGARAALGANPKVWVNQVVSLPAANAVGLNYKNLVKGFGKALTFKTDFESLFKYSPLAYERFRNGSNLDVGLLYEEKSFGGKLNKITDITTAPIQAFDKFTIGAIWNAALEQTKSKEYQDYSEDHYKKAAELTEKAITETQPNYTVLQRPEILRADSELIRLGTMFMTQPLQNLSLLASGIDKYLVSKKQLTLFTEGTEEYKKAKAQYEEAKKELWHKSSAVVVETTMLVLVAELFKMLLGKDDDKEFGERVLGDYLDSVIGMFPIIKDGYSLFQGYDISNMYYTGYTNVVEGVKDLYSVVELLASGKNYDQTTINSKVRKTLLGLSQTFGIPLRNIENYVKGIVGNISPATRLKYESNFTSQSTKALTEKLKTAIDKGDDDLADTVVGIMLDEKGFGVEDSTVRKEIKTLTINGYNVLPKGVGNSITYDGEEIVLTKGQAKAFKEIYSTANEALASLVKLSQYESATDEVKAKAINYIYNVYYNLALQDLLGEDLETKTVLFAEAIDVEKLAIIVATANSLKADVDKKGNVITGTRKKKIQTYINSLKLSAAQKYMIMGYLGFKNLKGETQVKAYINRLKLTKTEKEKLLQYSGYSK